MKRLLLALLLLALSSLSVSASFGCHVGNPCDESFCTATCPCNPNDDWWGGGNEYGNGDCDSNSQCTNGTCAANVGLTYGCQRWVDVCVFTSAISTSSSSSSSSYASSSNPYSSSSSSSSSIRATTSSVLSSSSSSSSTSSSSVSSSSSAASSSAESSAISSEVSDPTSSSERSSSSSSSSTSYDSSSSSSSTSSSGASSSSSTSSSSSSIILASTSSSALSSSSSSSSSSTLVALVNLAQTYPYSCSADYGLWSNVSAQAFYTEFNLTNLSQYILPELKNVFAVVTGDFTLINTTRRDNYTLAVYVKSVIAGSGFIPEENNIYVLIAGWDRVYNYSLMTTSNATITRYLSLNTTSFASDYNTYFVNIKNELTDEDWSYANLSNHSALIKCTDYSSFIYDCKSIGKPNFYLATRQAPSLQMVVRDELNNTHQREQKLPAGYNVINFYLIPKPFDKNLYTFGLVDYTGQYTDSVFQMQTHISYNYPQVFSRDFGSDGYVIDVECMPNHDYNLIVCSNSGSGLCASVGKYTCLKNETKTVVINTPQLGHIDYNFNDLTAGFTHNKTSRAVGLTYTAESSSVINYATFRVYNTSTGNYTLTYTSTLTTPTGVFAYTLPDYNASYYIEGIFNTTTHGVLTNGIPVAQGNFTLNSRFNMTHMPTNFLGISKTTFLALASYIIIVTVMLITGKGTDMGTGLITGALSWGLFRAFEWIPNTIPWWMFFIFMFIGVAVKWSEKRAEVVS